MRHVAWTIRLALIALTLGPAGSALGHQPYETRCAGCHGADGKADTPAGRAMKIASFAGSRWAAAEPEAICVAVRAQATHKPVVDKLDDEALLAACRIVKSLSSGE